MRRPFTTSDNNYDHGSLYIEPDGTWRVIAPTEPGPQPYNPGGEMVMWTSRDRGQTWKKVEAAHPRQPAQPHLRPPPAQRAPGLLRVLGRRQRARAVGVLPLLHQPATAITSGDCPRRWTGEFAKPEIIW